MGTQLLAAAGPLTNKIASVPKEYDQKFLCADYFYFNVGRCNLPLRNSLFIYNSSLWLAPELFSLHIKLNTLLYSRPIVLALPKEEAGCFNDISLAFFTFKTTLNIIRLLIYFHYLVLSSFLHQVSNWNSFSKVTEKRPHSMYKTAFICINILFVNNSVSYTCLYNSDEYYILFSITARTLV